MKDLSLLVWITQLGLSVALPLAGFVLLGVWLHESCGWGSWAVWAGIGLGLLSAFDGFRNCVLAMTRLSDNRKKPEDAPPVSFNDHS